MVHRCKIHYKILLDLRLLLEVLHRPLVVHLHLHLVQNLHREVNPLRVQHKLLLAIIIIHQQINLLLKAAAVVNLKQAKSKRLVIATAKPVLV
jgi:hypothetical protein